MYPDIPINCLLTEAINSFIRSNFTGIAISSNCLRIQFLFQRHRPIVKNPRTKGCDVSTKNRICEQLDDTRTPVNSCILKCSVYGYTSLQICLQFQRYFS